MNVRRLKVCMLTAVAVGLTAADASAFGGRLLGKLKGSDCCDPCAVASGTTGGCGTTSGCGAPAAGAAAAAPAGMAGGCAPTMTTVKETIMVPTQVQEARTVMKSEWKDETYTACKTEMVQETKTRTYTVRVPKTETVMENRTVSKWVNETVMENRTVTKRIPETVMETRTISKKVPVTKTVTVMETKWETQQVTEMKSKTVRHVTSVPTEVHVGPGLVDRLKAFCDPCAAPACGKTVTICKKQVCKETVCEPVTRCKKVKVCVPVTKQVCCYETVCETVQVPVCKYKCVTETIQVPVCKKRCVTETVQVPVCKTTYTCETKTENYTVCVPKQVQYQATRKVCVQVPHTEMVTVCKMVPKVVERQVAVAPCGSGCGDPCATNACEDPCGKANLLDKIKARLASLKGKLGSLCAKDCGCETSCSAPSCGGCN